MRIELVLSIVLLLTLHVGANHQDIIDYVWTTWTGWTRCSTTCGQGVRSRTRECAGTDGHRLIRVHMTTPMCPGRATQQELCTERICPQNTIDMYEYQCQQKDIETVSGRYHEWKPFTGMNMAARCELACVSKEYNSYYNFGKALDGTSCGEKTKDSTRLCVDGMCKDFGCDGIADSYKIHDWCGVCGGRNKNCSYVRENFDVPNPTNGKHGYQLVVKIPTGATHIEVVDKSYNYLAIADSQDMYLINGNYMLDWSGEYPYAGTTVTYHRNTSVEVIRAEGPLDRDLFVKIIFREYNPGVDYKFYLPTDQLPRIERPETTVANTNRPIIGPIQPHQKSSVQNQHSDKDLRENEIMKKNNHEHNSGDSGNAESDDLQGPSNTKHRSEPTFQGPNLRNEINVGSPVSHNTNEESLVVEPIESETYFELENFHYESGSYLEDLLNKRKEEIGDRFNTEQLYDPYPDKGTQGPGTGSQMDLGNIPSDPGNLPSYIQNSSHENANLANDSAKEASNVDPHYAYVDDNLKIPAQGIPLSNPISQHNGNLPSNYNLLSPKADQPPSPVYPYAEQGGTDGANIQTGDSNYKYGDYYGDFVYDDYYYDEYYGDYEDYYYDGQDDFDSRGEAVSYSERSEDAEESIHFPLDNTPHDATGIAPSSNNVYLNSEEQPGDAYQLLPDKTYLSTEKTQDISNQLLPDKTYLNTEKTQDISNQLLPDKTYLNTEKTQDISNQLLLDNALSSREAALHPNQALWLSKQNPSGGNRHRSEPVDSHEHTDQESWRGNELQEEHHEIHRQGTHVKPNEYNSRGDGFESNSEEHHQSNIVMPLQPDDYVNQDAAFWNELFEDLGEDSEENINFNNIPSRNEFDRHSPSNSKNIDVTNHNHLNSNRHELNMVHHDRENTNGDVLQIDNPGDYNYNRPNNNYPGDPYSESFRQHESHIEPESNQSEKRNNIVSTEHENSRIEYNSHEAYANVPPSETRERTNSNVLHSDKKDAIIPQIPRRGTNNHPEVNDTHIIMKSYEVQNSVSVKENVDDIMPVANRDEEDLHEQKLISEPIYSEGIDDLYDDYGVYNYVNRIGNRRRYNNRADYYDYYRQSLSDVDQEPYGVSCPSCPAVVAHKNYICESDFQIHGRVLSVEGVRADTRYEIQVLNSFESKLSLMPNEFIWARGACPCPLLQPNKEYIILGRLVVNFATRESRLMIEDNGYVTKYNARHLARLRSINKTTQC